MALMALLSLMAPTASFVPYSSHQESNMTDVLLGLKAHVPITTLESLRAGGNNASSAPYGSLVYRFYGFYG